MDNDLSARNQYRALLKHDILDKDQEIELITSAQAGDAQAVAVLVENNQRMVTSLACKYVHGGMAGHLELLDLVQYGNIGLLKAIEKFDIKRGVRFSTYAMWWIRSVMARNMRMQGDTISRTAREAEILRSLYLAFQSLSISLGRSPTIQEAAKKARISVRIAKEILPMLSWTPSLDDPCSDGDATRGDYVADPDSKIHSAEHALDVGLMRKAFLKLSDRELAVIKMRYGIDGEKELTYTEIGKIFGVSKTRIQQIEITAMQRLRSEMIDEYA